MGVIDEVWIEGEEEYSIVAERREIEDKIKSHRGHPTHRPQGTNSSLLLHILIRCHPL